jgi:hypothetical protein
VLAALLPGLAATAEPWEGIWAYDPDWCQFAGRIGSHAPAPIEITATEVNGLENFCDVAAVTPGPGGNPWWSLTLDCAAEGDTYDAATLLMLENPDTLWRFDGAGAPVRFTRCKETP